MSDVARLLDDLYTEDSPTRAPSWSSDEALDEAFSSWIPGPGAEASAAERAIVAGAIDEVTYEPVISLDAWRVTAPVLVDRQRWSPSDDDILPAQKRRR